MRTFCKVTLFSMLCMLVLPLSTPANADTPPTAALSTMPDISGTYNCTYHDPLSNPPDSSETITIKKSGSNYKVTLTSKDNVVPYGFGIGMPSKSVNNAFAYIYWQPKTPATTNVEFFIVKPDGSLDGVFAESNKSKSGTEVCTKSS